MPIPENWPGITITRPARRWIWTKSSSACWWTTRARITCSAPGKTGILWKLDRKTGKYLGHKEMVFQNVYDSINPTTGEPHYRNDIVEQRIGEGVLGCPSTEGGKNWPAMSYYQPGNRLIVPLSQSCLEFSAQAVEKVGRRWGGRRRAGALL